MHSDLNKLKDQLNRILIGKEDKVAFTLSAYSRRDIFCLKMFRVSEKLH